MSAVKAKRDKLHAELISAEKRKIFEGLRNRLVEAQRNEKREDEWEAEIEMMQLFRTREEYQHMLKLYDEY